MNTWSASTNSTCVFLYISQCFCPFTFVIFVLHVNSIYHNRGLIFKVCTMKRMSLFLTDFKKGWRLSIRLFFERVYYAITPAIVDRFWSFYFSHSNLNKYSTSKGGKSENESDWLKLTDFIETWYIDIVVMKIKCYGILRMIRWRK